jgi:hypothetical protein
MYSINAGDKNIVSAESHGEQYALMTTADDNHDGAANADNFRVHMLGPHNGSAGAWVSLGAIVGYNAQRIQTANANTNPRLHDDASTDPFVNMFDFSSEEMLNDVIDVLDDNNDLPPYPLDTLLGEDSYTDGVTGVILPNEMQHVARLGTEAGVGRVARAAGFCAPFGLICVDPHGVETAFRVVINLAAGTYHGVYAERA